MRLFNRTLVPIILAVSLLPKVTLFGQSVTPIAVLDFDGIGIAKSEAVALSNRLRNELFRLGKFDVVDRGNMANILAEQDFQESGCSSNECLVEVGRLLGAEQMVGGAVSKVGGTYTVSARLIDVETGRVLAVSDFDLRGEVDDVLTRGMAQVAKNLYASNAQNAAEPEPVVELPVATTPEPTMAAKEETQAPIATKATAAMPHKFRVAVGNMPEHEAGSHLAIGWRPARFNKLGPVGITSFAVGVLSFDDDPNLNYESRGETSYILAEKLMSRNLGPIKFGMQIGLGLGSSKLWDDEEVLILDQSGIMSSLGFSASVKLRGFVVGIGSTAIAGNATGATVFNFEIR